MSPNISYNDPDLGQKVRDAFTEHGFVILTDLNLPLQPDVHSFCKRVYPSKNYSIGERNGRYWFYEGNNTPVKSIFGHLENLNQEVLNYVDPSLANETVGSPHATIQFTFYPYNRSYAPREILLDEHYDRAFLTAIISDSVGGIMLKNRQGEWQDAELGPGKALFFLGTGARDFSNGTYQPILHKVVNNFGMTDRYACQFCSFPTSGLNVPGVNT